MQASSLTDDRIIQTFDTQSKKFIKRSMNALLRSEGMLTESERSELLVLMQGYHHLWIRQSEALAEALGVLTAGTRSDALRVRVRAQAIALQRARPCHIRTAFMPRLYHPDALPSNVLDMRFDIEGGGPQGVDIREVLEWAYRSFVVNKAVTRVPTR